MDIAHDPMKPVWCQAVSCMLQDFDDPRVRACGEDQHTVVLHTDGDKPLVHKQGVWFPGRCVGCPPNLAGHAAPERRHAGNLAADVEQVIHDGLRFP